MKPKYIIHADWNPEELLILSKLDINIDRNNIISTENESIAFKIKEIFKYKKDFYFNIPAVTFEAIEYENSENYLLINTGPDIGNFTELSKINNIDETGEWTCALFTFGEICNKYGTPCSEQINPFVFSKEPKLDKRYLWGTFSGTSRYIFTDMARYKILLSQWNLPKRELLIGKNMKVSKEFVQVDIPISNSELEFGDSKFGYTFKEDTGLFEPGKNVCPYCNQLVYNNSNLDFFPSFINNTDQALVFTKEWFSYYRRLVVNKAFANWYIENRFAEWNYIHIIPVKKFV